MDKYKKYTGVIIFVGAVVLAIYIAVSIIIPQYNQWVDLHSKLENIHQQLETKQQARTNVIRKLKQLQNSVLSSQKKIYSPVESQLGDDTLFFTLYSDLIEMVRSNTIKIKSIDYEYNPQEDVFVQQKGSLYFVCDVNMEIVSNYVNLGKLIQDIYQYPYYIKINDIDVTPYQQDKKILLSTISLRLYAHTTPEKESEISIEGASNTVNGASTPLPQ